MLSQPISLTLGGLLVSFDSLDATPVGNMDFLDQVKSPKAQGSSLTPGTNLTSNLTSISDAGKLAPESDGVNVRVSANTLINAIKSGTEINCEKEWEKVIILAVILGVILGFWLLLMICYIKKFCSTKDWTGLRPSNCRDKAIEAFVLSFLRFIKNCFQKEVEGEVTLIDVEAQRSEPSSSAQNSSKVTGKRSRSRAKPRTEVKKRSKSADVAMGRKRSRSPVKSTAKPKPRSLSAVDSTPRRAASPSPVPSRPSQRSRSSEVTETRPRGRPRKTNPKQDAPTQDPELNLTSDQESDL